MGFPLRHGFIPKNPLTMYCYIIRGVSLLLIHGLFCFPVFPEEKLYLKEISVNLDMKISSHEFGEALCNIQSQPMALGVSGAITSYKSFHQLLTGDVELLP